MGIVSYTIPTIGDPNATEDVDIRQALVDIKNTLNGNIDSGNANAASLISLFNSTGGLTSGAIDEASVATALNLLAALTDGALAANTVTDGKLASPNNSVYKTLLSSSASVSNAATANTYLMMGDSGKYINGASLAFAVDSVGQFPVKALNAADYAVAGKTAKLRVRATCMANGTAPGITLTPALYLVTPSGTANNLNLTLSAAVGAVAFATPAANSTTLSVSADFDFPATGAYGFGLLTSGTIAANSIANVWAELQTRNV
jgi:hypothetical protein